MKHIFLIIILFLSFSITVLGQVDTCNYSISGEILDIDTSSDPLNYIDSDANGNAVAVGLSTNWTTSSIQLIGGSFRVRLQHQPDVKTASSGSNDGDTDFDLSFVLNIE